MTRITRRTLVIVATAIAATFSLAPVAFAQQKKLTLWTHWDQNPDFNKWYADKGREFAKKSGYEVEVVTVPYQGYEAKYLAALMAKSGAPDIFMGMTHQWCPGRSRKCHDLYQLSPQQQKPSLLERSTKLQEFLLKKLQ